MNVQGILEHCELTEDHFAFLAEGVAEGYAALRSLAKSSPMLSNFMPGIGSLGYLRNIAVQHALQIKAGSSTLFYTKTAPNAARNQLFLQLQAGAVIVTAHYCGKRGHRGVPKAIARAELAARTSDLFSDQDEKPDYVKVQKSAYAQLIHGGTSHPIRVALLIPNRNQSSFSLAPMILPIVKPNAVAVEEVEDRLAATFTSRRSVEKQHAS